MLMLQRNMRLSRDFTHWSKDSIDLWLLIALSKLPNHIDIAGKQLIPGKNIVNEV